MRIDDAVGRELIEACALSQAQEASALDKVGRELRRRLARAALAWACGVGAGSRDVEKEIERRSQEYVRRLRNGDPL